MRLAGDNRYDTAARIATDDEASTVLLATGEGFADALAGHYLAGVLDAPLLLTQRGQVPAKTVAALDDLGTERVILLGGELAIDPAVVARVHALFDALPELLVDLDLEGPRDDVAGAIGGTTLLDLGRLAIEVEVRADAASASSEVRCISRTSPSPGRATSGWTSSWLVSTSTARPWQPTPRPTPGTRPPTLTRCRPLILTRILHLNLVRAPTRAPRPSLTARVAPASRSPRSESPHRRPGWRARSGGPRQPRPTSKGTGPGGDPSTVPLLRTGASGLLPLLGALLLLAGGRLRRP